ncbi:ATP-binding protein [Pokkaliibacter sp. CJK22405]|uniref:ATP-binding protein n=1 Tax=Pokkaliibacter sp. CJK22405 TaxID=3384615 RepID=UPI00398505F6
MALTVTQANQQHSRTLLRDMILMRLGFMAGQVVVLLAADFYLHLTLSWPGLIVTLLMLGILEAYSVYRYRQGGDIDQPELLLQLLSDLVLTALIFYQSGGPSNPFVSYLLVPVAFSALLLPLPYTATLTCVATLIYTLLIIFPAHLPPDPHAPVSLINVHIWGMWLNFLVISSFLLVFISRLARTLHQQQQALQVAREYGLRNAHLLNLASEAAGLAHELGTPLGTIQLLTDEVRERHRDTATQEDLDLLEQQLRICKDNLLAMVKRSEQAPPQPEAFGNWLESIVKRWHLMRPDARCTIRDVVAEEDFTASAPPSLALAILNVLNNAADASDEGSPVELSWSRQSAQGQLQIHIINQPGNTTDAQEYRRGGLGIGLFLTLTTLEQLGGTVTLENIDEGRTCCTLSCSLEALSP